MREIDRRLVRVETTTEALMRGAIAGRGGTERAVQPAAPPRLVGPAEESGR